MHAGVGRGDESRGPGGDRGTREGWLGGGGLSAMSNGTACLWLQGGALPLGTASTARTAQDTCPRLCRLIQAVCRPLGCPSAPLTAGLSFLIQNFIKGTRVQATCAGHVETSPACPPVTTFFKNMHLKFWV